MPNHQSVSILDSVRWILVSFREKTSLRECSMVLRGRVGESESRYVDSQACLVKDSNKLAYLFTPGCKGISELCFKWISEHVPRLIIHHGQRSLDAFSRMRHLQVQSFGLFPNLQQLLTKIGIHHKAALLLNRGLRQSLSALDFN